MVSILFWDTKIRTELTVLTPFIMPWLTTIEEVITEIKLDLTVN